MARVSFTVRSNTGASGSFLRYPDGSASPGLFPSRPNTDSSLRADGLQLVAASTGVSSFGASAITYGKILLDWNVVLSTPSAAPSATEVLIVYSLTGIPQTIASGTVIVQTTTISKFNHTGLTPGAWAYYGLFIHFTSTVGDNYYSKLAELEVLVPVDYGSTLRLWEQIPHFAKTADIAQGNFSYSSDIGQTHGDAVGPLFKYLSIIGFDMDRIRTLLDYVMINKDPLVSESETLNMVAVMLGIPLQTSDLGETRLRNVLDNIGVYRRSKGTPSSITLMIGSVTGSNSTYDATTHKYTIQSQRANYITVPQTGTGITTWRVANAVEVTAPQAFSYTGYNAASAGGNDVTLSGQTWTRNSSSHNILGAMIKLSSPIPVLLNDSVQFSVRSATPTGRLVWARLISSGTNVAGWGRVVKVIGGISYVEIPVSAFANTSTFTNCTLEFMVDLSGGTFIGQNYLAEANFIGDYFDGGTPNGGWFVATPSVSDYRWSASANASVSIYSEDYQRTVGAIKTLFTRSLPITEESKYAITVYNGIRGM